MADKFGKHVTMLDDPASRAVAITPDNSNDLAETCRMLYIGGAGTLTVTLANDSSSVQFLAVAAGTTLRIRAKRVHATGTSATGIIALY